MPRQSEKAVEPDRPDPPLTDSKTASLAAGESLAMELERHGIASVPVTFFDWGGYRYSNARDAIAAAKRGVRK